MINYILTTWLFLFGNARLDHQNGAFIFCPHTAGICWVRQDGLVKQIHLPGVSVEKYIDFTSLAPSYLAVLERGHGEDGVVHLFKATQESQETVAKFHLALAAELLEITGQLGPMASVICQKTGINNSNCGLQLGDIDRSGLRDWNLPLECVFPRLLPDRRFGCLKQTPSGGLAIHLIDSGKSSDYELAKPARIDDVTILDTDLVVALSSEQKIIKYEGMAWQQLSDGYSLWQVNVGRAVYFLDCKELSEQGLSRCSIRKYEKGSPIRTLWKSEQDVPVEARRVDDGIWIVVAGAAGFNFLLMVSPRTDGSDEVMSVPLRIAQ
jgi:hypothetical protein